MSYFLPIFIREEFGRDEPSHGAESDGIRRDEHAHRHQQPRACWSFRDSALTQEENNGRETYRHPCDTAKQDRLSSSSIHEEERCDRRYNLNHAQNDGRKCGGMAVVARGREEFGGIPVI